MKPVNSCGCDGASVVVELAVAGGSVDDGSAEGVVFAVEVPPVISVGVVCDELLSTGAEELLSAWVGSVLFGSGVTPPETAVSASAELETLIGALLSDGISSAAQPHSIDAQRSAAKVHLTFFLISKSFPENHSCEKLTP